MSQSPTPLAVMLTLFITLVLGSTEPMMNNDLKPKQIREAMSAEHDNAANMAADRERLTPAQRRKFAINSGTRIQQMLVEHGPRIDARTHRHARRLLWALDDIISATMETGYSEVTA